MRIQKSKVKREISNILIRNVRKFESYEPNYYHYRLNYQK